MGKSSKLNKRKHSLDNSSSSADISFNQNISGDELLNAKETSLTQQKHQDGAEGVSVNKAETLKDITERWKENSSAGDTRDLMCNSAENIRSDDPREEQFESYFESLAKRRSLSLDRQADQADNSVKILKEDLLKKNHGKLTELRSRTTAKTGSRHLTPQRKKIKTGIYSNIDFAGSHSNVQKSIDICPRFDDRVKCVDNCRQTCCVESSVNEHVEIVENVNTQLLEITNTAVAGQHDEVVSDRPVPIEISLPETVCKETTVNRPRPQMTEEQRKQMRDVQLRT